ncbi:uncharacterized protein [Euwallacea similis]|uniref:uncharacterized protein n=1 Tax=Euwallacea similis TaxID=1736056 RepID=UPI00344C734B
MSTTMEQLLQAMANPLQEIRTERTSGTQSRPTLDVLAKRLGTFTFDPSAGSTFAQWYQRHKITLKEAEEGLPPNQRVELLLQAQGEQEYRQLCGRVSPKEPTELQYDELVECLKTQFSDNRTLFKRCYDTLTTKATSRDIDTVLDEVNVEGDLFEFDKLNLDKFKLLLVALRMSDPYFHPYRAIILKESETSNLATVRELCRAHYEKVTNIQVGTTTADTQINTVHKNKRHKVKSHKFKSGSNSACKSCGSSEHIRTKFRSATVFATTVNVPDISPKPACRKGRI